VRSITVVLGRWCWEGGAGEVAPARRRRQGGHRGRSLDTGAPAARGSDDV